MNNEAIIEQMKINVRIVIKIQEKKIIWKIRFIASTTRGKWHINK